MVQAHEFPVDSNLEEMDTRFAFCLLARRYLWKPPRRQTEWNGTFVSWLRNESHRLLSVNDTEL